MNSQLKSLKFLGLSLREDSGLHPMKQLREGVVPNDSHFRAMGEVSIDQQCLKHDGLPQALFQYLLIRKLSM